MILVVGTTNQAKLTSVLSAVGKLSSKDTKFKSPIIKGIACSSGVAAQPLCEATTQRGAINRAQEAMKKVPGCDYGIGIESGVMQINDRYFEGGWVAIVDQSGKISLASSNRYELSPKIMNQIKNGKELSEAVEHLTNYKDVKTSLGMSGVITLGLIDRAESYVDAVLLAFGQFNCKELY
jgi:inosine/xanthosine triphosphatase